VLVSLSEVLGTMTGACGPYNLGGSATIVHDRGRRSAGALKPGSDLRRTIGLKPRRNYFVALDFNGDNLLCTFYWVHNG
jgi:hypothetical protein